MLVSLSPSPLLADLLLFLSSLSYRLSDLLLPCLVFDLPPVLLGSESDPVGLWKLRLVNLLRLFSLEPDLLRLFSLELVLDLVPDLNLDVEELDLDLDFDLLG
jgi:hypothetical protein